VNREAIMQALLTLVRQAAGFVTTGRRLEWISKAAGLPALYVIQTDNEYERHGTTFPPKLTIGAEIWIYAETDPQQPPGAALNPLLDAVEQALQPPFPGGAQTLGGLVTHCWIGGDDGQKARLEIWEGHAGERAAAIIPILILVP
jgi:hypothetical protein